VKRVALLLAVLAVAIAAWVVLGAREGTEDDAAAVERKAGNESSADLVTLRGRGDAQPDGTPREEAAPEPERVPVPDAVPRYFVRGEVRTTDGSWAVDAEVSARAVGSGFAGGAPTPPSIVRPDGRFDLDVSRLFAHDEGLASIEIRATHPYYVAATKRIDVTAARTEDRHTFEVELTLQPGYTVSGAVHDEAERPLAGADVAIFEVGPDGPVVTYVVPVPPLAAATTDGEGRFHVPVAGPGRMLVVAAAKGRQPAGVRVDLDGPLRVAPLVLRPGVAIEGRVVYAAAPVPGAWVYAETPREEGALSLDCGATRVAWHPGDALSAEEESETDASGGFRIDGLTPGDHDLRVMTDRLPGVSTVSHLVMQALGRKVAAPAAGVLLEPKGVLVKIVVDLLDTPVPDAVVRLETQGAACRATTDMEGVVTALLAPTTKYEIVVERDGFETARVPIETGPIGTSLARVVPLVAAAPRPALVLAFTGPHAETLDRVHVELLDLGGTNGESIVRDASGLTGTATCRFPDVPPGHYRITVAPGTSGWDTNGYYLRETTEVRVPPEGEAVVGVALRVGGRLRISARDESGGLLNAFCVVRDGAGEAQEVMFCTYAENVWMMNSTTLEGASPATVDPPLPAGTYTIELEQRGFEPRTVDATVREGETTDVDVKLVAR